MKKTRPPITTNHSTSPQLIWENNSRITVRFKVSLLKQDRTP